MIISLIAAVAENRVIGKGNRIPWHIREDLIHFKNLTLHHTVIMGRTTFDSILDYYKKSSRPIPERRHVIITRDMTYTVSVSNCFIAHSVDEALQIAVEKESLALAAASANRGQEIKSEPEVFISGGASIFKQTIGRADRLHLTIVHQEFEGDTHFPDYSMFTKVIGEEKKKTAEGLEYTFLDLER